MRVRIRAVQPGSGPSPEMFARIEYLRRAKDIPLETSLTLNQWYPPRTLDDANKIIVTLEGLNDKPEVRKRLNHKQRRLVDEIGRYLDTHDKPDRRRPAARQAYELLERVREAM